MRPGTRRALALVWLVGACSLGAACDAEAPAARAETGEPVSAPLGTPVLTLDFDDLGALEQATGLAAGYLALDNDADEPVTVQLATVSGGTIRPVPGRGGGYAVRFPGLQEDDPKRAVLVVTTTSSDRDPLGPGAADFAFGADFVLDEDAEQAEGADNADNGNNLVQRGLYADDGQYKIQVDHGRASCRVAGAKGEAVVTSPTEIVPGTWYRVTCARTAERVTLEVDDFDGVPETTAEDVVTGTVQLARATPLVIGGKATAEAKAVAGDSDQFNGALDNVYLTVDETD